MKVEANGEGWRGEADLSSTLRCTVNDVGDNDVSISSLKRAGILPQMWDCFNLASLQCPSVQNTNGFFLGTAF